MKAEPEELADFVAARMREEPRVAQIVNEAHLLDGLKDHAGWKRLIERVRSHESRWMETVTARLMRGERVEQTEIDYRRGFYEGARWILEHPAQAEAALEEAAQAAWREVQREALLQQELDSPFLINDIPQEGQDA